MHIFYTTQFEQDQLFLLGDEYNHCKNVLRLKIGDTVKVLDGIGKIFEAKIQTFQKDKAILNIQNVSEVSKGRKYSLTISISPTKNIDRIEWFVEKSIEIGVDQINFILTQRTERRQLNMERLNKIAISAMKQSMNAYLPIFNYLTKIEDYVKNASNLSSKFIAHLVEGEEKTDLKDILQNENIANFNFEILIGPEGDFTKEEVDLAIKKSFRPVSLGKSRLRTETAGIMSAAIFSILSP